MRAICTARIWPGRNNAAGYGVTLEQITDKLLHGRDLSKKGNRKRQLEYVTRTVEKALRSL